jgi:transketolase
MSKQSSVALAQRIRERVIECSKEANVGHIGSCLSVADIIAALFADVLRLDGDRSEQDRFVLSKGHAALALYAALEATGAIGAEDLARFCSDGTPLGTHPEHVVEAIDFSTGSLGHGLSIGVGAALAARREGSARRAFVLLSDAECNEGSVWEAAMFAAHHRLSGVVAIIDVNGQQATGYTADVLEPTPLADRWQAFGWDVHEVDGHDTAALAERMLELDVPTGGPHVLLARTTFGSGVSYMEGQIAWHYWPMSDDQHRQAVRELANRRAATAIQTSP